MALFRYNATSNKLVPITSEGSVGIPVGAVMAFAEGTTHENWLLCDGRDTTGQADELATHYPALYTYLGNSNVLPAQFDHSKLSDYETFTLPTTNTEMQYDGVLFVNVRITVGKDAYVYINGKAVAHISVNTGAAAYAITVPFKKGDMLRCYADQYFTSRVAYYKQPLYIKATSAGIEVDKDLYATKGYIRDQNVLSGYELLYSGSTNQTFTAPYDGYINITSPRISSTPARIIVNGTQVAIAGSDNTLSTTGSASIKKGDEVNVTLASNGTCVVAYYKLRDYTGR